VLCGLDHREPPALLAGRHDVHPCPAEQFVLAVLRDVAVEGDRVADAEFVGALAQVLLPPAAADDVQVQCRNGPAQLRDRGEGVLDLLVRHQPRQHAYARVRRAGLVAAGRDADRDRVGAVAHHGNSVPLDAEVGEFVGRRQRHGQVLAVAVHARGEPRLDPPADAPHEPAGDGPLLAVAVVDEHGDRRAGDGPGEERDAVLGVDDGVGSQTGERAESEAPGEDRSERPRIHREPAAAANDADAVDDLLARGAGIPGGAERDLDAAARETRPDLLEVPLAAAALGMPGVAPAQQENLSHVRAPSLARTVACDTPYRLDAARPTAK